MTESLIVVVRLLILVSLLVEPLMDVFLVFVAFRVVDSRRKGHILPILLIESFFEDFILFIDFVEMFLLTI